MASIECGRQSRDILISEGPSVDVIINNQGVVRSANQQLSALIDTGAEWNLIEETLASTTLNLKCIDYKWIQTAKGPSLARVYQGLLVIPSLTYSKPHRFIGADLGADRAILGREALADFLLTYSGRSGRVTLEF